MYLLKLDKQGDIYKDDDGVVAVPEFLKVIKANKLGTKAMIWVALVCDYDSPYKHINEKDRKRAVARDLFGNYSWAGINRDEIKIACNKYKELQFDPLDEQLLAFNKKIDEFTEFMKQMRIDEDNADKLQKIMIGIEKVLKTRQTLIDAIERRGERQKIAGDKGLSFLEQKKVNKIKN
jgi:hypothetical protein